MQCTDDPITREENTSETALGIATENFSNIYFSKLITALVHNDARGYDQEGTRETVAGMLLIISIKLLFLS